MNDRSIKDEGFIRYALQIAKNEDGRWIANQSHFNGHDDDELYPAAHAALVTAVAIYVQRYNWDEARIKEALAANTHGRARELVDRYRPDIPDD